MIWLCLSAISVASQPNQTSPKREQSADQKSTPTPPAPNNNITTYYAEHSDDNPPKWYAALERPDWWIVVIAAVTGFAVFYQAREMKEATDVMRGQLKAMQDQIGQMEASGVQTAALIASAQRSADAAKISADIAARVSVPTLVVEKFEVGETGVANLEAFLQYPQISMTIKNCGQTPAFLKWWTIIFTAEDLPEIPVYNKGPAYGMPLDKVIVDANKSYTLPPLSFPHRTELPLKDARAIIDRQAMLNVYGFICYGDLFGNPWRRLKFCETALNLIDGEKPLIQWVDFGEPGYVGTDQFPANNPSGQRIDGQPSRADTKAEDRAE